MKFSIFLFAFTFLQVPHLVVAQEISGINNRNVIVVIDSVLSEQLTQHILITGAQRNETGLVNTLNNKLNFNYESLDSQQFVAQNSIVLSEVRNSSVAWGDYDNDGDLDILLTGLTLQNIAVSKIYRNEGNNTFTDQSTISLLGVQSSSVAWGDYDNDGDLDILLTGYDVSSLGLSKIFRNNGNNVFEEQVSIPLTGVARSAVAWGDYDNDGDLDILISGRVVNAASTKIYRNEGNNTFTAQTILSGIFAGQVAWGDYDNDGDLDVFLTGKYEATSESIYTKVFRNDGDGIFNQEFNISLQPMGESELALGDYDFDGDLDLLLVGYQTGYVNVSYIYRNEGNNSFALQSSISLDGVQQPAIGWGDYDNDGDFDILLTGNNGSSPISKIYQNDGNNNFIEQTQILLTGVKYSSVAWADYDNDGDLDFLLSGASSNTDNVSIIYQNINSITNTPPTAPNNLVASVTGNNVHFNWDKATDLETSQNGLTYNLAVSTTPGGCDVVSSMSDISNGFRRIVGIGNTNHNNFWSLKGLDPGTYYWSVQAIDNSFSGSSFASETTFTIIPAVPEAPSNLNASVINANRIDLEWADNSEFEDGFIIERNQLSHNEWITLDTTIANQPSFIDSTVITDTNYCYRIKAYNLGGVSDYSNEACGYPHPIPRLQITNPNGGEIWLQNTLENIEWISENISFVNIELSIDNGNNWFIIDSSYVNNGVYSWTVSGFVSLECKIRITDFSDPTIWDTSAAVFTISPATNIEQELLGEIPSTYTLYQNYPNPFNPTTNIVYFLPITTHVSMKVYDAFGQEVSSLVDEYKSEGFYNIEFNAADLASGIYFYQIKTNEFVETKKLILLR